MCGRGRVAVAVWPWPGGVGRVVCMWSVWPAWPHRRGRVRVAGCGRMAWLFACDPVAGWCGLAAGWPDGRAMPKLCRARVEPRLATHVHTCNVTRVQSATEWTASVHKCYGADCLGTYFTHVHTCNVTRVQSATEWTASVHTLHMSTPVV